MTAGADPAARIIDGPVGAFLYSAAIPRSRVPAFPRSRVPAFPRSCVPAFLSSSESGPRPAFHRFIHTPARGPADGFVDLSGRGTGLLWLNGFLLGRYDTPRGPQCTLYAHPRVTTGGAS
ncbi:hypothetical protein [Streptomyces erythrochromogenes]|uniref:hypothetical protein n=1 Tax=Streptomyces erythrochromogenes TaxID=285574 RepID=UPI0038252AB0